MPTTLLMILDGWGERKARDHNALALARLPNYRRYLADWPSTVLAASGPVVGLPEGVMGNSEVGHMNIGAGRIVYLGLSQIFGAIEDGSFYKNEVLVEAVRASLKARGRLHLIGLLSDAGVHSHIGHLFALMELAKKEGQREALIHCIMDGRDTAPTSGAKYLKMLEEKTQALGIGRMATVSGRYWAMDRDQRWERTRRAYEALVHGKGEGCDHAAEATKKYYGEPNANPVGFGDEFIPPTVVRGVDGKVRDGDAVICFNFRPDRVRQITRALTDPAFDGFDRGGLPPKLSAYACMMRYDKSFDLPVAFPPVRLKNILPAVWSARGLSQLRLAETEKYAHVTYFFNGGEETVFPGEERKLIPSIRDVATYNLCPEMSAPALTAEVRERLKKDYDLIVMNLANPDMVGHTGVETATIRAVECVDGCLGQIVPAVVKRGGTVIITADHGNCEEMVDNQGLPHTQHSLNPVPFLLIGEKFRGRRLQAGGKLGDIAPTILEMMGIPQPEEMSGVSLLVP